MTFYAMKCGNNSENTKKMKGSDVFHNNNEMWRCYVLITV